MRNADKETLYLMALTPQTPDSLPVNPAPAQPRLSPGSAPARMHVAYLDGLRALAGLFVVMHHVLWPLYWAGVSAPGLPHAFTDIFWFGHFAVGLFIVLSGFCLALPVVRGDGYLTGGALKFFGKRARRILPTYYIAMGLSLLLIWLAIGHKTGTLWDISLPVTAKAVLAHLLLVQDVSVHTNYRISPPLWSISVEWRIYFLFPLLVILRRSWGSLWVALAAVAVSCCVMWLGQNIASLSHVYMGVGGSSPQYFALFAFGILAADIACSPKPPLPLLRRPLIATTLLTVSTLLLLAGFHTTYWHGEILPMSYADFVMGFWSATLLIAASNPEIAWLNRILSWRPLVFIGTFAYSLYLIHMPLVQLLWQYVFAPLHGNPTALYLALVFVGVPLIVGVSYLFFLCCERPFLNRRKRETMAETERDAALSPAP